MKKSYMAALVLSCCALPANAQQILGGGASISGVTVGKVEDRMFVSMDISPDGKWNVKSNQSIVLTPRVESDGSGVRLPQVLILGRNQYIRHLRNASESAGAQVYKATKTQGIHYEVSVPYEEWMADSRLVLNEDLCGCTKTLLASGENQLERYAAPAFRPVFAYIVPQAEAIKSRSKSGQAYVTFPVSETYIDDSYLGNREELQKIQNTIASVRNDKDVTITGMQLKGYASPEGKYQDNERLAKGRTEAVADYIRTLSDGADYPVSTSFEAENWEGLRDFISRGDMAEKAELLAVIDSPEFTDDPDGREWKIKSTWPDAYRRLLTNCYPFLRRTDYRVEYTVRPFNLEEARALVGSQPQKLSLQEMYNVAQSYEPGSEAYNNVFDTAVHMFPDDETANLNAANSALQQGNTQLARKYLAKAGNSGEAIVARGILAMLEGDTETALSLMGQAQAMGIDAADANIEQIRKLL